MAIDYSKLVNLPVGTVVCITGKKPFDTAHLATLNRWSQKENRIQLIGLSKDESLKPGISECRFLVAEFFKPDCFIRSFGARLKELTITIYKGGSVLSSETQTDNTPDLPASEAKPPITSYASNAK